MPAPRTALPWLVASMSTSQPPPSVLHAFFLHITDPLLTPSPFTLCSPFPNCILFFHLIEHRVQNDSFVNFGVGVVSFPQTGSPTRQQSYLWPLHTRLTSGLGGADTAPRGAVSPFWVLRAGSGTWEQQGLPFQGLAEGRGCLLPEDRHRGALCLVCARMTGVSFSSHGSGLRHAA